MNPLARLADRVDEFFLQLKHLQDSAHEPARIKLAPIQDFDYNIRCVLTWAKDIYEKKPDVVIAAGDSAPICTVLLKAAQEVLKIQLPYQELGSSENYTLYKPIQTKEGTKDELRAKGISEFRAQAIRHCLENHDITPQTNIMYVDEIATSGAKHYMTSFALRQAGFHNLRMSILCATKQTKPPLCEVTYVSRDHPQFYDWMYECNKAHSKLRTSQYFTPQEATQEIANLATIIRLPK